MTTMPKAATCMALAALVQTAPTPASGRDDVLGSYRWKSRVVVLAAADPSDPRLVEQRAVLASVDRGRKDRDLVIIEAVGSSAPAEVLRRRLEIPPGRFRAVLIGKDGGVKLSSADPIPPHTLFATIDAMPMRREEMRQR